MSAGGEGGDVSCISHLGASEKWRGPLKVFLITF